MPPGAWTIEVGGPPFAPRRFEVAVRPGETTRVALALEPLPALTALSGTVRLPGLRAHPHRPELRIRRVGGAGYGQVGDDAPGSDRLSWTAREVDVPDAFAFDGDPLAPGEYALTLVPSLGCVAAARRGASCRHDRFEGAWTVRAPAAELWLEATRVEPTDD